MMKVRTRLAIGLLSGLAGLSMANSSFAQVRYEQLPLANPPKNFVEARKEPGPLSQASKDAIKGAIEFRMGKLTEGKESPDKVRADMDNDFRTIVSEDGLAIANKTALDLASKVVKGNYLPAAKINAMLTIAEMSEGPVNARNVPANAALSELFAIANNPQMPSHLRSLALLGLDRHVKTNKGLNEANKPSADKRNSIAVAMVGIASSQPTSAAEEQGHWWMVRRAYDVLLSLHAAGERAKEPLSPGLKNAAVMAMDHFNDPTQFTSIRYSAGTFLTRFDFAAMKPAFRMKLFLGVAQFLDQEVVGWYENESDKTKMLSGATGMGGMMGGGMGGMGDGGGMMGGMGGGMDLSGGGDAAGAGGIGGMGGGEGGFGMQGGKGGAQGPKPIDTQSWDLRIARRKLNMYTQLSHALLKGTLSKDERDYHPTGKGIMEAALPESHNRAGRFLIESLEEVQVIINEKSLTTVGTLMSRLIMPLTKMRDAVELIPAYEEADPTDKTKTVEVVKSFKDFSPRMKSFKKADASGKLESAVKAPPAADAAAGGAGAAAPAGANPPAAAGAAPGAGATPAAGAAPAAGAQPPAQPGAQPGQPNAAVGNPVGGAP